MKLGEFQNQLKSSGDMLLLSLEQFCTAYAEAVRGVCRTRKKQLKSEINVNICKHICAESVEDLALNDVRKLPDLVEHHFSDSLTRAVLHDTCVGFLNGYLDLALKSAELGVFDRHLYLFGMDEQNPFDDSEDAARKAALEALKGFVVRHRAEIVEFFTCDDAEMTRHGQKPNTMLAALKVFVEQLKELSQATEDLTGKLPGNARRAAAEAGKRFSGTLIHGIIAFKFFYDEAEETIFDIFGEERLRYFSSWENFFTEYLQKAVETAYEHIIRERLFVPDSYEESGVHYFRIAFHMGLLKHVVTPPATGDTPLFRATIQQHARMYEDPNEMVKWWLVNHGKRKLDPFRTSENEFKNLIRAMKIYPEAEEYVHLRAQPEVRRKKGAAKFLDKVLGRGKGEMDDAERLEILEHSLASIAHAVDDVLYYYADRFVMGAIKKVFSFTIQENGETVRISRVAKRVERVREKTMLGPAFYKWTFARIVHMVFYDIIRDIKGSSKHEFIEGLKDSASIFDKDILVIINVSGMVRDFKARLDDPGTRFLPPERAELAGGERQRDVLTALNVYESILNYTIPEWVERLKAEKVKGFVAFLARSKGGGRSRLFGEMLKLKLAELLGMNGGCKDSGQLNFFLIQEALKAKLRMLRASPADGEKDKSDSESEGSSDSGDAASDDDGVC